MRPVQGDTLGRTNVLLSIDRLATPAIRKPALPSNKPSLSPERFVESPVPKVVSPAKVCISEMCSFFEVSSISDELCAAILLCLTNQQRVLAVRKAIPKHLYVFVIVGIRHGAMHR